MTVKNLEFHAEMNTDVWVFGIGYVKDNDEELHYNHRY